MLLSVYLVALHKEAVNEGVSEVNQQSIILWLFLWLFLWLIQENDQECFKRQWRDSPWNNLPI